MVIPPSKDHLTVISAQCRVTRTRSNAHGYPDYCAVGALTAGCAAQLSPQPTTAPSPSPAQTTRCQLAVAEAPARTISFKVTNDGDQVTEFYLLGDDGLRVVSEAENIGPGLSRELVAQATEGKYFASASRA